MSKTVDFICQLSDRSTDFYDFSEPFSDLLWSIQTWRHQRHDSTLLLVFVTCGSNFKFIAKKIQWMALKSRALYRAEIYKVIYDFG